MEYSDPTPNGHLETGPTGTGKAKRYLVAAALMAGGVTVGAVVSPVGLASADDNTDSADDATSADDSTGTESADTADDDADERHGRRGPGRRGGHGELGEILGLDATELKAQFDEDKTVAEIAAAQGISEAELTEQLLAAVSERLDAAVAAERIDADEAAEHLADAEERIADFINRTPSDRADGALGHGVGERHGHGKGNRGLGLEAASEALGLTTEDLQAGLAEGKSLADMAADADVSTHELVDALVASATARLDEAVTAEKLDEEKADELKANLETRIEEMIDKTPGERSADGEGRRGFGRRGPGSHGHGPQADGSEGGADVDGETVESSLSA